MYCAEVTNYNDGTKHRLIGDMQSIADQYAKLVDSGFDLATERVFDGDKCIGWVWSGGFWSWS